MSLTKLDFKVLSRLRAPTRMPINDIHAMFLGQDEWLLSARAELTDPLYDKVSHLIKQSKYDDGEALCGITLDNTTFIWIVDPQDGYRSSCDEVIVVPHSTLRTPLPSIPIFFRLKSDEGMDSNPTVDLPFYIEGVCKTTGNVLFQAGTEVGDSYYPMAVGHFDVPHLDLSAKLHTNILLTKHTKEAKNKKSPSIKKKKM